MKDIVQEYKIRFEFTETKFGSIETKTDAFTVYYKSRPLNYTYRAGSPMLPSYVTKGNMVNDEGGYTIVFAASQDVIPSCWSAISIVSALELYNIFRDQTIPYIQFFRSTVIF